MRMLKRIALVSGVLTLICAIGAAVVAPFAVADAIQVAKEMDRNYSVLTEVHTLPGDGVKTVGITGNFIDVLRVRESGDNQIHVYIDGYRIGDVKITSHVSSDGFLELRHEADNMNFLESFTRENLLRNMAAGMNNTGTRTVELHLPKGISLNFEENHGSIWYRDIAPGIEVIPPTEREDFPYDQSGIETPESPDLGEVQEQLYSQNEEIRSLYRDFRVGNLEKEVVMGQLTPILTSMSQTLAPLCQEEMNLEAHRIQSDLENYARLQAEYSLVNLERERNQERYENGEMEKAAYYNRDLELDRHAKSLDGRMDRENDQLESALATVEGQFNITLFYGKAVDSLTLDEY